MNYAFVCEFEELESPLRNSRTQVRVPRKVIVQLRLALMSKDTHSIVIALVHTGRRLPWQRNIVKVGLCRHKSHRTQVNPLADLKISH